jgi:hypothetical protein
MTGSTAVLKSYVLLAGMFILHGSAPFNRHEWAQYREQYDQVHPSMA